MTTQNYQVLATAHHKDDQIETMIMKMVREGNLFSAKGIVADQSFGTNKKLVRPLLQITKEEILNYSKNEGIFTLKIRQMLYLMYKEIELDIKLSPF
ncbi:hypothetical protein GCM10025857_48110 [Alicyclobacillus contaminans]|nr:hypothetical protein GCM10025857_48110 [Alicyclobacillus contaminans]